MQALEPKKSEQEDFSEVSSSFTRLISLRDIYPEESMVSV
jgi:hypothetical protein